MTARRLAILAALTAAVTAAGARAQAQEQQAETFRFPETQDTTFGDGLDVAGSHFNWFHQGQGVKGTRVSSRGIVSLTQFVFGLRLGPSCVENPNPLIDMYVNDVFVYELRLPEHFDCTYRPDPDLYGASVTLPVPIPGRGANRNEYEIRYQLKYDLVPLPGTLVFVAIDPGQSVVDLVGDTAAPPPTPPPPPPPPPDPHPEIVDLLHQVLGQLGQLSNGLAAQDSRLASVETRLGNLSGQLTTVGNGLSLQVTQLSNQLSQWIAADRLARIVAALGSGHRSEDLMTPPAINDVSTAVGEAIATAQKYNLRPAVVVNKANTDFAAAQARLAAADDFGAYALLERAYQTLVEGNVGLGPRP
ncbi:MAG TPA: hypothetical protein VGQ78_01885 [Vicinamibacteria bacterium]|nr:hypothetical protein [Vicinamibacteria bacterium]